jgi:acetyl-CoA decarbonylase/synthase, CODH/ACS complex subunit delta
MGYSYSSGWSGTIRSVTIGATKEEGGTRTRSYQIGGDTDLSFINKSGKKPLVAFEICDDISIWPEVVRNICGDKATNTASWARYAEKELLADCIKLNLTSTSQRNFSDFKAISDTIQSVLESTGLPLIIEGSNDPDIDSEVFVRCGEAGQGEKLLLGTAEADRYRSVAAAAMAYGHVIVAQTPIDVNLAKQLNILLRETGVPDDQIVIDPYTGALGYGFEYTYSTMERIRFAALKGDTDLAMPMISTPSDSLTVKEIREAENPDEIAVLWEHATAVSSAIAGAAILVVRHPGSVQPLKETIDTLWQGSQSEVDNGA